MIGDEEYLEDKLCSSCHHFSEEPGCDIAAEDWIWNIDNSGDPPEWSFDEGQRSCSKFESEQ